MTDIRKSDAQLDAEAAVPPIGLEQRLALHRLLAAADVSIHRLHQRDGEPANEREFKIQRAHKARKDGPKCSLDRGGWTGLPFSHPFQRFLDEAYGVQFPWSAGLKAVRVECRRSHSEHWHQPEWDGSLCYALISMTCRFGWSFDRACYHLLVTPERTEPVMHRGLRRIEQKLEELQARATETVHADKGRHDFLAPAHEHHAVPGMHELDCIQCLRKRAAA